MTIKAIHEFLLDRHAGEPVPGYGALKHYVAARGIRVGGREPEAHPRFDHGAQYVSLLLGRTMRDAGIRPSMGSISSPWDNAVTESLMGAIKSECVHARTFDSRERAALEIFDYIEGFYNRLRIHSALGWLSPAEFEEKMSKASRSEAA